ncbi:uncharacterized protein LOC143218711 isoform X1 [Lasioglossum baleicum]|uniref:uncharacterized protein LOC143218711 isoform X1 n=1 Tax=Lasioglossum baleicum TaxID=434251 RepID=UPI003FCDA153
MEFTLEDTVDMLKETRVERLQQIDSLVKEMSEISPSNFNQSDGFDEIRTKQYKMCNSLLKAIVEEKTEDYPIPRTLDLQVEVLRELEEQQRCSKNLRESLKKRLSSIREDISYLQNKKTGLEKMKQAYLDHEELIANTTYNTEKVITKRIFKEVKIDLDDVVEILFPGKQNIRDFLSTLIGSFVKGGDDVYVDIIPEAVDFSNFLIEADIAAYHRNDKNKIRLVDMI